MDPATLRVARQYERHPFPDVPLLALPTAAQAHTLSYELSQYLRTGRYLEHDERTRILVAGAGSFEAIIVARAHPRARIVAVDLSSTSLKRLRRRAWLAGHSRRIECVQADLHDDLSPTLGHFDYVVCTGVLHHSPDPRGMLTRLAGLLNSEGVLRLMTYAFRSRGWIYALQRFFRDAGLTAETPGLKGKCARVIAALDPADPLRSAFETYTDARTLAGLVDGFFHAWDRPIPLEELRRMARGADLRLVGFGHAWHSQPAALERALRDANAHSTMIDRFRKLDAWTRLALLDDCHELAVNPVLWLARKPEAVTRGWPERLRRNPVLALGARRSTIAAPLMPPSNPEDLLAFENPRAPLPPRGAPDFERWCEGGWLLGEEGILPPALAEARCATETETDTDTVTDNRSPLTEIRYPFTENGSPIEALLPYYAPGLSRALGALGGLELAAPVLARILEPRVDFQGRELPWLSAGDLLNALLRSGELSLLSDKRFGE